MCCCMWCHIVWQYWVLAMQSAVLMWQLDNCGCGAETNDRQENPIKMGNNFCCTVSLFVSYVEATWDDILALALCTPSFRFQQCVRGLEACASQTDALLTLLTQKKWKKQKQIILSAPTMMHFIRTHKAQILRRPNKIVFPPTKLLSLSKVNSDVSWHVDWRLYLGLPCVDKKCHLGNFQFSPSPSYLKIVKFGNFLLLGIFTPLGRFSDI